MKIGVWLAACLGLLLAACGGGGSVSASKPDADVVGVEQFRKAAAGHRVLEYKVKGADGTNLATYVYLPKEGAGPFPVLVMRTPYELPITPVSGFPEDHPNAEIEAKETDVGWTEATDRGYALVIQFVRGRYESDGLFSLFLNEVADGDALLRWVEKQPWSNGKIGVFGDSASGNVSLQAAASGRASVRAVYAQATSPDFVGGVIFPEGRIKWEALLPWVLNQSTANSKDHDARLGLTPQRIGELQDEAGEALAEMFGAVEEGDPSASSWWTRAITPDFPIASQLQPRWGALLAAGSTASSRAAQDVTDRITAPTLHVSLWHDFFQESTFKSYGRMQAARGNQKLIVLDGTHYDVDDPELWPSRPMFDWFDYWLKGSNNGVAGWPTVQYRVAGKPEAGLRTSATWPPAAAVLQTRQLAAPSKTLTIDPTRPAPTLGGNHLTVSPGMEDQQPLLARADVVELPGAPLDKKALMTGSASATLQVLESGGGDIVVKLVDRRPDGEVRLLRETVVVLGGAGSVTVNFSGLAYEFDAGSAPGLLIAGASLPAFRSVTPPLSGQVRLGAAQLRLPLSP